MTAVESLRRVVANLLDNLCTGTVTQALHDTCLVLADACEEDGLGKFANFWRLVAARKVWPNCKPGVKHFEWWRWTPDIADIWSRNTRERPAPTFAVTPDVFSRIDPRRHWYGGRLATKHFHSLSKAILSLEKAWGAVDCEAASV